MSVYTIELRRDPAATWTAGNPVLHEGEPGYEEDTNKLKIGDGVTAWADLEYIADIDVITALIDAMGASGADYTDAALVNAHDYTDAAETALAALIASSVAAITYVRQTVVKTTAALANNTREQSTIALPKGYRLLHIATDRPCRTRLYVSSAQQISDAARLVGVDPSGNHGIILDFVSTALLLLADLSPLVDGFDGDSDGAIPITIDNLSGATSTVQVTLTYVRTE